MSSSSSSSSSAAAAPIDVHAARAHFPALNSPFVFADNAGGTQVLRSVVDRLSEYMLQSNVQMADYAHAHKAAQQVANGKAAAAAFVGEATTEHVMFGSSATQLFETLSRMIEAKVLAVRQATGDSDALEYWQAGDEVIISQADHEANRGAWKRLAERLNLTIKSWNVSGLQSDASKDASNVGLHIEALRALVTPRTRIVAFTASSNVLGSHWSDDDFRVLVQAARDGSDGKAYVFVDAVAFAPHARLRPRQWGVDAVVWSWYKVFGAHIGSLYASKRLKETLLVKLNHHFLHGITDTMYPFQPSSEQYELIASVAAIVDYLVALGNGQEAQQPAARIQYVDADEALRTRTDKALDSAYERIARHEAHLAKLILDELARMPRIAVLGDPSPTRPTLRAPTVSFYARRNDESAPPITSKALHARIVQSGQIGAQVGHMYAYDLTRSVEKAGIDIDDGVVRISFVHYSTPEEVRQTLQAIADALQSV